MLPCQIMNKGENVRKFALVFAIEPFTRKSVGVKS